MKAQRADGGAQRWRGALGSSSKRYESRGWLGRVINRAVGGRKGARRDVSVGVQLKNGCRSWRCCAG